MRRAAHQLFDEPRVFEDPLACRILGADTERSIRGEREAYDTPGRKRLRAFLAARSRYAEDALDLAFARGVRQYVVLGAGFDTYAYRKGASPLRVFEVDHPATQAHKRELLAAASIPIPPSLTFAPIDFEAETLLEALCAAGFDARAPAFFSWLGVTPYLTTAAVMETLGVVARRPAGSEIVFDFAPSADTLTAPQRLARAALAARVASVGEPWVSFFDPCEFPRDLTAMGFGSAEVVGSEAIDRRYFRDRADGLRLGGSGYLMHALSSGLAPAYSHEGGGPDGHPNDVEPDGGPSPIGRGVDGDAGGADDVHDLE